MAGILLPATAPKSKSVSPCIIPLLCLGLLLSILLFRQLYSATNLLHVSPSWIGHHVEPCSMWRALTDHGANIYHTQMDEELFARAIAAEELNMQSPQEEGCPMLSSHLSLNPFRSRSQIMRAFVCEERLCLHQQMAPKLAFLFITTGMLPFAPLWNEFFRGHEGLFNIYIHLDPFQFDLFNKSSGVFFGRLICSDRTQRGTASLIAAARRLLANALLDDPLNEYFVLISDHCIPLYGFQRVYRQLMSSNSSYVEILDRAPYLYNRYIARGREVMLPEVPLSMFRTGSQFFTVTRKHARMFVADQKYWKKFSLPCVDRDSCFVEEHYFPTLMEMEDPQGSTGYTLTFVNWNESTGSHPKSYESKDVTRELIVSMRQGDRFLFARKFDDGCLDMLMRLAAFIFRN